MSFPIFATIRQDSKYFRQGLSDPDDPKSVAILFVVRGLFPDQDTEYPVHFNNNCYRLEDVDLYVNDAAGKPRKISGGAQ